MKKAITFIKHNFITSLCFFLAAVIFLTSVAVTYAKYLESETIQENPSVGAFSYSASIDGVSALSFTNTAFWGGSGENRIAMNALRSIDLSVNNFETVDGKEVINTVKTEYELTFTAPMNFIDKLAIQLFDGSDSAILPQIVVSDILKGSAFTAGEDANDYNGTPTTDIDFNVTSSGEKYTAESVDKTVSITLAPVEKEVSQTLYFRLWNTTSITSPTYPTVEEEGGKLYPPVCVTLKDNVIECYQITIKMPEKFILPAAEKTTHSYILRIAPTSTLEDDHLGGVLMTYDTDSTTVIPITNLYEGQTVIFQGTEERIREYTDIGTDPISDTQWYTVLGSAKKYTNGQSYPSSTLDPVVEGPIEGDPGTETITVTDSTKELQSITIVFNRNNGNQIIEATFSTEEEFEDYGYHPSNNRRPNNASTCTVTYNYLTVTSVDVNYSTSKTVETRVTETITAGTWGKEHDDIKSTEVDVIDLSVKKDTKTITSTTKTAISATETCTGSSTTTTYRWNNSWNQQGNPSTDSNTGTSERTAPDPSIYPLSSQTEEKDSTTTITRRVSRSTSNNAVAILETVTRTIAEDEVTADLPMGTVVSYTSEDNALELYTIEKDSEGNDVVVQIFVTSQCYSKDFPLDVHVEFKQTS